MLILINEIKVVFYYLMTIKTPIRKKENIAVKVQGNNILLQFTSIDPYCICI